MKKTLIAGAASLALAAMPIVGAFAANPEPVVDNITITVTDTCTFERTVGNGNYSASLAAPGINNSIGTSTFKAVCNNASGFAVSATPTALTGTSGSINYSATDPVSGTSSWTATKGESGSESNIAATGGTLMSSNTYTSTAGVTEVVVYKAATASGQPTGSYTGTMTYALTQNS